MKSHKHLPTWISGKWSVTAFRDSLISTLQADRSCTTLSMYFYAVTQSGWDQVRQSILGWKGDDEERSVILFVGTDHGITDPIALEQIGKDGIDVRLMIEYNGIFHPKVVWLQGSKRHIVWVGSNNLTRDGLLNNIEFALLVRAQKAPTALNRWAREIEKAGAILTPDLLKSYRSQRLKFEKERARARMVNFTWSRRSKVTTKKPVPTAESGSLIVEVMPRETGANGKQLQLPVKAATEFFGVEGVGSNRIITLQAKNSSSRRQLTITVFGNHTVRVEISDLEYGDRPCVLVFRKVSNDRFEYEIVSESNFPKRYKSLLALCTKKTRSGSRRWGNA